MQALQCTLSFLLLMHYAREANLRLSSVVRLLHMLTMHCTQVSFLMQYVEKSNLLQLCFEAVLRRTQTLQCIRLRFLHLVHNARDGKPVLEFCPETVVL